MDINTSGLKKKGRARSHTCVIFNPEDGAIQHLHTVTTLGSGKRVRATEVEREALTLAREAGRKVDGARLLHLPDAELRPYVRYRVDLKTSRLVEEPLDLERFKPAPRDPR